MTEVEHKELGKLKLPGFAPQLSENHVDYTVSPELGGSNEEIYKGVLGLSDEEFCTRLIQEAGVAAVPGSCFACPGHIRISYCCSDDALATGLARLENFLKTL